MFSTWLLGLTLCFANVGAPQQLERAMLLEEGNGDLATAERIYRELLADESLGDSYKTRVWLRLGICLERQGKPEEAAAALKRAADGDGVFAESARSILSGSTGAEERLVTHVEELILRVSQMRDGWDDAKSDLVWIGSPAVPLIVRALRTEHTDLELMKNLGDVLLSIGGEGVRDFLRWVMASDDMLLKRLLAHEASAAVEPALLAEFIPWLTARHAALTAAEVRNFASVIETPQLMSVVSAGDMDSYSAALQVLMRRGTDRLPESLWPFLVDSVVAQPARVRSTAMLEFLVTLDQPEVHKALVDVVVERGNETSVLEVARAMTRQWPACHLLTKLGAAKIDPRARGSLVQILSRGGVDLSPVLQSWETQGLDWSRVGADARRVTSSATGEDRYLALLLGLVGVRFPYEGDVLPRLISVTLAIDSLAPAWVKLLSRNEPLPSAATRVLLQQFPGNGDEHWGTIYAHLLRSDQLSRADKLPLVKRALAIGGESGKYLNWTPSTFLTLAQVRPYLENQPGDVVRSAVYHLASLGGELELLVPYLSHADSGVRGAAARTVLDRAPERAAELLVPLLQDTDSQVRRDLAVRLGGLDDPVIGEAIAPLLLDPVSSVRKAAESALLRLEAFHNARDRWRKIRSASTLDEVSAVAALIRQAQPGRSLRVRLAAIRSLPTLGMKEALPALIELLDDPAGDIQEAAAAAVKALQEVGKVEL